MSNKETSSGEIKDAFESDVFNTLDLCKAEVNNFVIPPYQRYYTWSKDNIEKLLEDLYQCININKIRCNSEYRPIICFLGTIIVVKFRVKEKPEFINQEQGNKPESLDCIIDGQQRITTIQLIATVLYERLKFIKECLENQKASSLLTSLISDINSLLISLKDITSNQNVFGDSYTMKYVPKLIRVPDDYFDMRKCKSEYNSIVGGYLATYTDLFFNKDNSQNNSIRSSNFKKYKLKALKVFSEKQDKNKEQKKLLCEALDVIDKFILNFCLSAEGIEDPKDDFSSPGLSAEQIYELINSDQLIDKSDYLEDVDKSMFISELNTTDHIAHIAFEMIILTKCFLYNLAFTYVVATNEDYAFSMFDSLNTSGELLTAYETYKAKVINRTKNYSNSLTNKYFNAIDNYLNKSNKENKKNATNNLLISFARETDGTRVGKNLNDQRLFLNTLLSDDAKEQENYVKELYVASIFWKEIWEFNQSESQILHFKICNIEKNIDSEDIAFDANTSLCIAMLVKAKHTIVAAPIIRFLSFCYDAVGTNEFKNKVNTLQSAIRTIAAFSCIYRISTGKTEGIDLVYKNLFVNSKSLNSVEGICWKNCSNSSTSSSILVGITERLMSNLKTNKMYPLNLWQNKGCSIPTYKYAAPFAVFILICYWSIKQNQGIDVAKLSINPELIKFLVNDEIDLTIEHIAPQTQPSSFTTSSWDRDIYNDNNVQHNLGNLLIVDRGINSILGNSDPATKVALYDFFAKTPKERNYEDFNRQLPSLGKDKFDEYKNYDQQILIKNFEYREVKAWSAEKIKDRFNEITSTVWELLEQFLKK